MNANNFNHETIDAIETAFREGYETGWEKGYEHAKQEQERAASMDKKMREAYKQFGNGETYEAFLERVVEIDRKLFQQGQSLLQVQ